MNLIHAWQSLTLSFVFSLTISFRRCLSSWSLGHPLSSVFDSGSSRIDVEGDDSVCKKRLLEDRRYDSWRDDTVSMILIRLDSDIQDRQDKEFDSHRASFGTTLLGENDDRWTNGIRKWHRENNIFVKFLMTGCQWAILIASTDLRLDIWFWIDLQNLQLTGINGHSLLSKE